MSEYTTIHAHCPNCRALVQVETWQTPGEISGNAGFILQCSSCDRPFALHVSGFIGESRVTSGAQVLETYFDDVAGSREGALAKYGLS